jgi:hypothetical protein
LTCCCFDLFHSLSLFLSFSLSLSSFTSVLHTSALRNWNTLKSDKVLRGQ